MGTSKKARARPSAKRRIGRIRKAPRARRRTEKAHDILEEQLSLAAAAAGLGTWIYDIASGGLSWSKRSREIFGIPSHTPLTYRFFADMIHPEDRSRVVDLLSTALAKRTDYEADFRIVRADGALRWVKSRGRGHYDAAGKPLRVVGIARDVTRQTIALQKMQRSLDRIKTLRDIDTAITSTLDLARVLELLLDKIVVSTGYAAATVRLVNRDTGQLEPVAAKNVSVESWKRTFSKIPGGLSEVVLKSKVPVKILDVLKDARTRHQSFMRNYRLVSFLGIPLVAKGERLGVLAVFTREPHDFDDEEVEFLATIGGQAAIAIHNAQIHEQIVTANKVKEEFLSVMSHELRTPLSVMMGYGGMLLEGLLGDITPQQEEAVRKILARASEQLYMINSIIQTTQLESRALRPERRAFRLAEMLRHLRQEFDPAAREQKVKVVWKSPPEAMTVVGDGGKVSQILRSLIANAVKFTRNGTVTVGVEVLRSPKVGACLTLRVTDTGVGIASDNHERIFDKFQQLDSSETRVYGGLGLGLYVAKKLTELLGGKIVVDSVPGRGSIFTVEIPCTV
ncbi:MAG TPA: ATP-binding protein [Candidatus Binatia bacterium]|jgi:PAS domain S-box-containing protein